MTTLLPSACSPDSACRLGDALTDTHHIGAGLRRGVGQVDGVASGDDERVAAGERTNVEDGQVVVVLVDPDCGGLSRHDGAEHTAHSVNPPRARAFARLTCREFAEPVWSYAE